MINPAKYYNPKLLPLLRGSLFCVDLFAFLTTGVCLECRHGLYLVALKEKKKELTVSKVMRMEETKYIYMYIFILTQAL